MLKKLSGILVGLAAVVVLAGVAMESRAPASASTNCAAAAGEFAWQGTLPAKGIRDYSVEFCGPESLDVYAGAHWKGNKSISLVLIEPDGTQHLYTGSRNIGGEIEGPLASGTWTIVVRNATSASAQFQAEIAFE